MNSPLVIPDHTLLRPIGRGAYGEVWLARNVMGVLRAVKVVERRQFNNDRPYEREFEGIQRYEPVSRSADGLVHVLHVGRNEAEGYFYYVMELADDAGKSENERGEDDAPPAIPPIQDTPRTLRSDLKRLGRLPIADCLRVALDVVSGLARLHERGLVHRDVKPGNIIFVEGRAKLADIGLLSIGGEARTFVGTEGYIPPEGPGTSAADLYALGMVLYEAATGHTTEQFPKTPPEWFAEEAGPEALEFHDVVLKACEGGKERRYQGAEEMQADLAFLQSGQSVRHLRALQRRMKRLRQIGWAAGVVVALAVVTAFVANWRTKVATDSRAKEAKLLEQAQKSLARAESAERESRQELFRSLLEQARATVRSGELGQRVRALDAIGRAASISNSVELRREVLAALALPDLRFERGWPTGPEYTMELLDLTFHTVALCRGSGPVEIRTLPDWRLQATLHASTNRPAYGGWWSADGQYLAVKRDLNPAGERADLEVWEMQTQQRVLLLHNVMNNAISLHPGQHRLIVAQLDRGVTTWDLESGRQIAQFYLTSAPNSLKFAPDGQHFAVVQTLAGSSTVSVHDAKTGALRVSHNFADEVLNLDWHPSGCWVAAADYEGMVHLMDPQTGQTRALGSHKAQAATVAFHPDGDYLFSGGWEGDLICWDLRTMERALTIGRQCWTVQFRSGGQECALITRSGIEMYSFVRPNQRGFAEDLGPRLRHASFSSDGRWLAACADRYLGVWDLNSSRPGALVKGGDEVRPFLTSDAKELFASSGEECSHWRLTPGTNDAAPPGIEPCRIPTPQPCTAVSLFERYCSHRSHRLGSG